MGHLIAILAEPVGQVGVRGVGNVHVLGDRGTVRMTLANVKRFASGVVLLTYHPAS